MALERKSYTRPGVQAVHRSKVAWRPRRRVCVSVPGAAASADLGGSSKYSKEELEDRSGEGFRGHSKWPRVSRA
jgi:hypothetical protein